VKLIVQPGDGITALVQAINGAKSRVEIAIFRFDRGEIAKALASAVGRGVFVHALIAYTNRGGERNLRALELELLEAGVTVARTADDLARYHAKYMIIDRKELYLLSYNFTYLDIDHSRSFGLIIRNPKIVQEAVKLFEADTKRQQYSAGQPNLVVSPVNARKQLAAFIKGAKKHLFIYDPEISDAPMIRLLEERKKAGVDIRIIGKLNRKGTGLAVHKMPDIRLHTRSMVRDGSQAFIGSQSLREVELGARRELGVIFRDPKIVARLIKVFEEDWAKSRITTEGAAPVSKVAKKVARVVTKDLPAIAPFVEVVVKDILGTNKDVDLDHSAVEESVKDAVKETVKEAVKDVVGNAVEQNGVVTK